MLDIRTGKEMSRRDFGKGIAAILAAGCAPTIVSGAMMRMTGARMATVFGENDLIPLYEGVSLVGSSVQNNNGILSGFTSSSYATLPFHIQEFNRPWKLVISAHPLNTSIQGGIGGVGTSNGWTPIYFDTVSPTEGVIRSYLNGVGWNVVSLSSPYIANEDIEVSLEWDGSVYTMKVMYYGTIQSIKTYSSSVSVVNNPEVTQIGTNRGNAYPFSGTWNLNKCYLMFDGQLYWEGVRGAHKNTVL